jgi:hypothetical protein
VVDATSKIALALPAAPVGFITTCCAEIFAHNIGVNNSKSATTNALVFKLLMTKKISMIR